MTVRKGYAATDAGQVHYRRAGTGGGAPTVVLLHQTPASSWMYEAALELLGDRFDAIAPDTPGFGGSFAPATAPGIADHAAFVRQALDDLGIDRFHVVGHHTGASVAVELAHSLPARARSLVAVGPPYLTGREREDRLDALGEDYFPPVDRAGEYLQSHWQFFADETDDLPVRHRLVVDSLLARGAAADSYRAVYEHDFRARFDDLALPRLAMAAPGDALWDGFCRVRDTCPDVDAVELAGGNYEPLFDAEAFASEVAAFVRSVEP